MSVGVVRTDPDDRDLGRDGRQERRIGRRRAVVWHREQVRPQRVGPRIGRRAGQEVGVRRQFGVAGEQRAPVLPGDPHHQRAVVELTRRPPVGPPGIWAEHLEVEVADPGTVAGDRTADRHVPGVGRVQDRVEQRRPVPDRAEPHGVDPQRPEHVRRPAEVVRVTVGEDQQVEVPPPVGA